MPIASVPNKQRVLQRLAAVELEQRVLGRRLALQELGEAAVAHRQQRLRVDVEAGDGVAVVRVLAQGLPVRTFRLAQLDEGAHHALHVVGVVDPEHRPFVRERALGDRPPAVERADQVLLGHAHVGEEHFVEVAEVFVGKLGERAPLDAGRRRVDDQRADALVLGRARIGAHEAQAPVGVMRARCPHLLAVDDELVADQLGARLEACEIAARAGLAHAEAPRDLGAQRGEEELLLLLGRAVVGDRRGDDAEALRVRTAQHLAAAHLLEIDHLLVRVRVATAELGRPAGNEPTGVEQFPLPVARPLRHVGARLLRLREPFLGRLVLVEPGVQLGAEGFVLGCVTQAHRSAG